MLRNNAFLIFKTFTKEDIKNFRLFINSPFFNKNKKIVILFDVLIKYFYPTFDSENLSKEFIFKKIQINSESRLRDLFSVLFKLCEEYLSYLNMTSQKYEKHRFLMHEYEKRGELILYEKSINNFENKINSEKLHSQKDFFYKYLIYESKHNFSALNVKLIKSEYLKDFIKYNNTSNTYINCFCLINNILTLNDFISRSKKVNVNIEEFGSIKLFDEILKNIGDKTLWNYLKGPLTKNEALLLEIYYYKYHLRKNSDINTIKNALAFLKKNISEIEITVKYNFFSELLNQVYAISNCDKNMENFEINFYDFFLKSKGYEIENEKYMSFHIFKFFIMRGFSFNKSDWIKKYFKKYINYINPKYKIQFENYYNAYHFYKIKKFEKSLEYCGKVTFDNYLFKRDIKMLYVMLFYELENFDAEAHYRENFRKFIMNSKLASEGRVPFIKFVNFIKKLVKLNESYDEYEAKKLKTNIENSGIVGSKFWLIEKVEKLIKEKKKWC